METKYMGSAIYGPSQLLHRKNTLHYQLKIRKRAQLLTEYSVFHPVTIEACSLLKLITVDFLSKQNA